MDEVELNLSYQIKTHFHEYMDIMINMNKIEVEINEALKNIAYLKYCHRFKFIFIILTGNIKKDSKIFMFTPIKLLL